MRTGQKGRDNDWWYHNSYDDAGSNDDSQYSNDWWYHNSYDTAGSNDGSQYNKWNDGNDGWPYHNSCYDNAGSNDGSQHSKRWNDRRYTNADNNDCSWYNSSWYRLDGDSAGSNDTNWCNESASQKRRQRRKGTTYHGWFDSWHKRWNNSRCDDNWYDNDSRW